MGLFAYETLNVGKFEETGVDSKHDINDVVSCRGWFSGEVAYMFRFCRLYNI